MFIQSSIVHFYDIAISYLNSIVTNLIDQNPDCKKILFELSIIDFFSTTNNKMEARQNRIEK